MKDITKDNARLERVICFPAKSSYKDSNQQLGCIAAETVMVHAMFNCAYMIHTI